MSRRSGVLSEISSTSTLSSQIALTPHPMTAAPRAEMTMNGTK